jgi:arylsulfatase A-like enzyme
VLGGGDCDDFDREVHPGAFDWPDDGVDQDCNGHQATLTTPAPAPFAAVPASVPAQPNVVLITIDALRADHLGAYGYSRPTTPRLDALAKQSALFLDAWAHAPSTRYSIPAILTGRYPSAIATDARLHWPPQILPSNRLLAEILKDRGYYTGATASYGGSGYFEPGWGVAQGFDEFDTHLKALHSLAGDPSNTRGTSSRQLADLDIAWIAKHKDQKFFFWSHFYDTHFGFERHPDMPESNFGDREIDLYDGEIRFTDFHIGRVLDALKAAGLWDKTIVIVTADHGDGFGEHGIPPSQRHGYHLYENETKVPLIIHVPGLPPRVVRTPVGHVDIVPTLLNLVGGHAGDEPTLLGRSRLGLMTGAAPDDLGGEVFQEVTYEGPSSRYDGTQKRAVVTHDWHLIRNVVPEGTTELYRRRDDAAEDHDLAGVGLPAERTLSTRLAAWMDALALPPDFARRVAGNVQTRPYAPKQPLGDDLGGWLVVDGADVVTPVVQPGGTLEVDLYLHARAPVPSGWHLVTHVVGAGRMLNADHEPVENTYPLRKLRPGTFLRARVRVTLPASWPAGPLTMRVGLWQGPTRARATGAPAGADNAVDVAHLSVAP